MPCSSPGAGSTLRLSAAGRAKLALLEAGLKGEAAVKLPLQRRRAAGSISRAVGIFGRSWQGLCWKLEVVGAQTLPG